MTLAGANYSFVLSKKFNFSFDYKFSYGTTSGTQFLNYIQIGSKLVLQKSCLDKLDFVFSIKQKNMAQVLYFTAAWCGPCKMFRPT